MKKKKRLVEEETPKSKKKKEKKERKGKPSKGEFTGHTDLVKSVLLNKNNSLNIGVMTFPDSDNKFVDIRKHYKQGDDFLPTAKGVAIDVKYLPVLIKALKKIQRMHPVEESDDD